MSEARLRIALEDLVADRSRQLRRWIDDTALVDVGDLIDILDSTKGHNHTDDCVSSDQFDRVQEKLNKIEKEHKKATGASRTWNTGGRLPCPNCGNYDTIFGYNYTDENDRVQHTHYVCRFWDTGKTSELGRCGWHGWFVPGWNKS